MRRIAQNCAELRRIAPELRATCESRWATPALCMSSWCSRSRESKGRSTAIDPSAAAFCCIAAAISPPAHRLPIARAAWQSTANVCEPDPCSCALRSIETARGSAFAWRLFGR